MKNKEILPVIGILAILLTTIGLTYAFFQAQSSTPVTRDVRVLTHTVDMLTFSIDEDISVEATQLNFTNGGDNQDGESTATAILTPNSKTGTATRNYYLYLNIESNPFVYSAANTNHDPELLLQVFDSSDNLVTLTGLGNQVTIDSLTGYDITTARGLKTLLDNHTITASNNATTTQDWRIVVTLVNLDVNQNDNTGKTFEAELIIQEDELDLGFTGTIYRNNTVATAAGSSIIPVTGTQWVVTNGTQDSFNYNDQATCNAKLIELNVANTMYCEEKSGTFGGVGTYETSASAIRTKTYSVYCPIGGDNLTCGNDWYYPTEQDCLDNVNTSTYTCTAGSITKPYYLKHEVEYDIIENTEVCIWYNNHEFCIAPNYWDTDVGTTKTKLKADMENALGITIEDSSCNSNTSYASCGAGGFFCNANSNGAVDCNLDVANGSCSVSGSGNAFCREDYRENNN